MRAPATQQPPSQKPNSKMSKRKLNRNFPKKDANGQQEKAFNITNH